MKFEVSAKIDYTTLEPCTFVLNIHALNHPQKILRESFIVEPYTFWEEISPSSEGNRLVRITVPNPGDIHFSYRAQVQNAFTAIDCRDHMTTPISQLPPAVFTYLHPSRYCQSDKLYRFANHQFGKIENEFSKVLEVTEWIHRNVEYLSGSTNAETSAYDTVTQQAGVCRDFAHLGIALCRALTIPARYCSVYAFQLDPQDFHACFEAYLSGRWIIFDATKLVPLNGFIKIAMGRDAADTAIANLFGNIIGNSMQINCLQTEGNLEPFFYEPSKWLGICYD
ncbi:MAG: transglutaminase family protein [Chitinophagaceae bacterium]|nr:transglutaminase family protein [Chitinophagaceae bacterium]